MRTQSDRTPGFLSMTKQLPGSRNTTASNYEPRYSRHRQAHNVNWTAGPFARLTPPEMNDQRGKEGGLPNRADFENAELRHTARHFVCDGADNQSAGQP